MQAVVVQEADLVIGSDILVTLDAPLVPGVERNASVVDVVVLDVCECARRSSTIRERDVAYLSKNRLGKV
jgi:hypothetical protein